MESTLEGQYVATPTPLPHRPFASLPFQAQPAPRTEDLCTLGPRPLRTIRLSARPQEVDHVEVVTDVD